LLFATQFGGHVVTARRTRLLPAVLNSNLFREIHMIMQYDELFWERIGATTTWGKYISGIERATILNAQQLLPKPGVALEVGCEGGRWSAMLSDLGWKMICTEVNQHSLNVAKSRIPSAEFILVSPNDHSLPCQDRSVDLVLCVEVFHVVHSRWFLTEAVRVLRPGGVLVGVATNSLSLRGLAYRVATVFDEERRKFLEESRTYTRSYRSCKQQLFEEGMKLESEEGICWFPFGRQSNSSLVSLASRLEQSVGLRRLVDVSPWVVFIARKVTEGKRRDTA
jgi:ubiquinone/menaquinone biosynthesis C-methylase UbiE